MQPLFAHTIIVFSLFFLAACSQHENPSPTKTQSEQKPESGSASQGNTNLQSRLNSVENDVEALLAQLTLEEKASLVHANGKFFIGAVERLGIHEMWMSDGPHGVRYEMERHGWAAAGWNDDYATYLPPLTAVAASWNPKMATLHGNVLGSEARERQKDIILGPGVNLARLPLYGRNFEYLGEDPYLAAKLVVPEVKAIQANDVAATMKHYALNTQELNRGRVDAKPDERTLREVYLAAFEAGVKEGGVHAIMGAYNSYYGTNSNQSKHLIMDILKGEWGFKGLVVTDWGANINTRDAALYGLDIEMGTRAETYDDYYLGEPLLKMIRDGEIPVAVLDEKVRRVLRVQLNIGMMDKHRKSGERNTLAHQAAAREIAAEGVVLLKNENILPLDKSKIKNILVIGPNADKAHGSGGGSSEVKSLYEITPLQGLQAKLGDSANITVLRARGNAGLQPIAGDYIASRHWTGTTAWNATFYEDALQEKRIRGASITDSTYSSPENSPIEHMKMNANVAPLQSGKHVLKVSAKGSFKLNVNDKTVISFSDESGDIVEHEINLLEGETYAFEISYSGNDQFTLGWDAPGNLFSTEEQYLSAAKNADVVFYFGGLSHGDDREAIDRKDMRLPNGQDEVIAKLLEANKNTVVFLVAGSAVEMPWVEQAPAIVWGWYGGMEAGHAYADVLFGDINPGGKMPITLPAKLADNAAIKLDDYKAEETLYPEGVFIGYRWFEQQNIKPLFPFGHGLSYTSFTYSDIALSASNIRGDESVTVSVTVTNTGKVAGAEVVQLYLHDKEASVERPQKELKGFTKVVLQPGESKTVELLLTTRDLSFWDIKTSDWLAESGEFEIMLGASVADIRLNKNFTYTQ